MLQIKDYDRFLLYSYQITDYEFNEKFNFNNDNSYRCYNYYYNLAKHNFARFWFYLTKKERIKWLKLAGCKVKEYSDYNKFILFTYDIALEDFRKKFYDSIYKNKKSYITKNKEPIVKYLEEENIEEPIEEPIEELIEANIKYEIKKHMDNTLLKFKYDIILFWISIKHHEKKLLLNIINAHEFTPYNKKHYKDIEYLAKSCKYPKPHEKYYSLYIYKNDDSNKVNNVKPNVKFLECQGDNITQLDNLPIGLIKLKCCGCKIKNLDYLPATLEYLNCSHNPIKSLDYLPRNLKYLECCNTEIENFDCLPESLLWLDISINEHLKQINNLPKGLLYLNIRGNNLEQINNLPKGLLGLNIGCNYNLKYIDTIPNYIEMLWCDYIMLDKLKYLPNNIMNITQYCNFDDDHIDEFRNKLFPFGTNGHGASLLYIHNC